MKISFIIPVYNLEQYLPECVSSIIDQGETDIQVLLIDDGSTDGSSGICEQLSAAHSCIRVIHQKNRGAAAARNTGLDYAEGEYVAFVDGDDRLSPGSIPVLLEWARTGGADLCFLDAVRFYPDGRRIPLAELIIRDRIRGKDRVDVARHLATRPKFSGSACTKLFRKTFLEKNHLRFPAERRHCEDVTFCRDCILRAESFDCLDIPYYEYRQMREESVTATFAEKGFYDLFQFVEDTARMLTVNRKAKDFISGCMMSAAAYEYVILIWHFGCLPWKKRKKARETIKPYTWVLSFSENRLFRLAGLLTKLVGFSVTSWLLDLYKRAK